MITEHLKGHIKIIDKVSTWEEAIKLSSASLVDEEIITKEYIEAMIENVKINGSYIVIMPEIAIPHAKSEHGAKKMGLSFLRLRKPVMFPDKKPVKILITLSSDSPNGHLEILGTLATALMNEDFVTDLKNVDNEKEVLNIFNSIENNEKEST